MTGVAAACDWGDRLYLHLEGINSAAYVWANGRLLGYSQDSCLPAEFEATHVLRPGRNLLTVQVPQLAPAPLKVWNTLVDVFGAWLQPGQPHVPRV